MTFCVNVNLFNREFYVKNIHNKMCQVLQIGTKKLVQSAMYLTKWGRYFKVAHSAKDITKPQTFL